jgi:hypothetical protein
MARFFDKIMEIALSLFIILIAVAFFAIVMVAIVTLVSVLLENLLALFVLGAIVVVAWSLSSTVDRS